MNEDDFAGAMDIENPSWFIAHANEQELRDFAYLMCQRRDEYKKDLRYHVARRLFVCARATYAALHEMGKIAS